MKRTGFVGFGLLAFVALAFSGCSASVPPTTPVTGKVVFKNGKPLPQATVQFVPAAGTDGHGAQGTTDATGSFALTTNFGAHSIQDGAVVGKYKVVVIPYPHGAKIDVKYASPVYTPLQVDVPEGGVSDLKLVVDK
jgi:hypothetical protein